MNPADYTRERALKIADDLQGTCKSLDTAIQEEFGDDSLTIEQMSMEFLQAIDEQVMLCEQCGWWVEAHEVDDEGICDECRDE